MKIQGADLSIRAMNLHLLTLSQRSHVSPTALNGVISRCTHLDGLPPVEQHTGWLRRCPDSGGELLTPWSIHAAVYDKELPCESILHCSIGPYWRTLGEFRTRTSRLPLPIASRYSVGHRIARGAMHINQSHRVLRTAGRTDTNRQTSGSGYFGELDFGINDAYSDIMRPDWSD